MTDPFKQHGAFSWCELMTTDVEAAKHFYGSLFGWEMEETNVTLFGTPYTSIKAGGTGVGGIMAMPPQAAGAPPHWGSYVTVDDVDATANKVEELGGQICKPPTDIPGVGRFCVFQDPQGAIICAITYSFTCD